MELLEAQGAGIMLIDRNGKLGFAAASGARVAKMERLQEHSETGVCSHAFTITSSPNSSSARAFERLRERSMNENRKLRDVAQQIVDEHE